MPARSRSWLVAPALVAALACGSETTPEQRLEKASEALAEAREDVEKLRSDVAEVHEREREASEALREARRELRQAEQEMLSAEQRVDQRATDVALFRTLQAAMLESPELRRSAVEVRVNDGAVTLAGSVADESAHQRALAIASETPGVRSVRDELEVEQDARASASAAAP